MSDQSQQGSSGQGAGAGQEGGQGSGQQQAAWYGELPADRPQEFRDWVGNKGFKDPVSALESYYNAEKLLGGPADQLLRLPKPDDKAGWDSVWARLGRPEKAEQYELPVPEGDSGEFAKVAAGIFHQAGVPKAAAQSIAKAVNEHAAQAAQQRAAELQAQSERELAALKQEWGNDFEKKTEFGRRGLAAYGKQAGLDEGDLNALEMTIGTAKMLKLFSAIGETTAEHGFGGGGNAASFGLSPQQAREKIEEARMKRIKGEMLEKDYMALMDRLGPIAASAAN